MYYILDVLYFRCIKEPRLYEGYNVTGGNLVCSGQTYLPTLHSTITSLVSQLLYIIIIVPYATQ
jgi:hypothetical protein